MMMRKDGGETMFQTTSGRTLRALVALAMAVLLAMPTLFVPQTALGYFNRGSVEVSLGSNAVSTAVGARVDVSVTIVPAQAEQTLGCGMPKCPQSCSSDCMDDNGQCQCGGSGYDVYRATARASSTRPAIATGIYRDGVLSIYGRAEGEADITLHASLRQYTDAEVTVHVTVAGTAEGASRASSANVPVPEEADAAAFEDRQDLVDRTIMGRSIRYVRIGSDADAATSFNELLGTDADVTFWSGDTYYHPDYSLTFQTKGCSEAAPSDLDPTVFVSTAAEGPLFQLLDGLDSFVVADFEQQGALPACATVYALADGALSDGDPIALFSYDRGRHAFVREDADAAVVGGYAVFEVCEGKTYVASSRDLENDANAVVNGAASDAGESCCTDEGTVLASTGSEGLPPFVYALIGAGACAVVVVIAAAALIVIRKRKGSRC